MSFHKNWIAAVVAVALFANAPRMLSAADILTIGSDAPKLDIEHWIQDGDGKFKPVTKFEAGKVYVVEFWATWCGPCIASMPHLAELQQQYVDKGVRIVSISDEDLETVEGFLEKPVRGEQDKSYRELTKAWSLTTDPDGSSYKDYMEAAGQNGIPTAFVVGKDSKIDWIGHPSELDGVLEGVVSGSWDREAFAAEFKAQQELQMAQAQIMEMMQKGDIDGVLAKIDELLKRQDDLRLRMFKLQVLLQAKKPAEAIKLVKELYAKGAEDPALVDMVAWNFYEMASQTQQLNEEMINVSVAAVESAVKKAEKDAQSSMLDTLAHLLAAKGDLDKAIEMEKKAIELGEGPNLEFYQNYLKELEDAKAKKDGEKKDTAKAEAVK